MWPFNTTVATPAAKIVNPVTERTLKEIHTYLLGQGWKYDGAHRQSAVADYEFVKMTAGGERRVVISAWHGTGRWGDGKVILGVITVDNDGSPVAVVKQPELVDFIKWAGKTMHITQAPAMRYINEYIPSVIKAVRKYNDENV